MTNYWMKQTALAISIVASLSQVAGAQEGGPSAERFFGFIDRNRDGVIDRKEAESAPGPMRDTLLKLNIDKGLSQKDFEKVAQPMMDSFRRRDDGGDGRSSRGGDDRDREREKERERERGPENNQPPVPPQNGPGMAPRPDSGSSSSKSSSGKKSSSPKVRVTFDLPSSFRPLDLNHDGQIGLFEWDRTRYADFTTLDRNGDGLLTAKEVLGTKISPPKPRVVETAAASDTATTPAAGTASTGPASTGTASTGQDGRGDSRSGRGPGGPGVGSPQSSSSASNAGSSKTVTAPEKVDADSQEGRMAKFNFGRLDLDKDGSLTTEEWSKSQSIRQSFEKAGVKLTLPLNADQFAGWQIAVQKAERGR